MSGLGVLFLKPPRKLNAADGDLEIPIGIIFNGENGSPEQELNPSQLEILLEGNVVMDSICSLPLAMCLLFGLTYALRLEYPKCMKNTFLFIQQIMLNLGRNDPPPKLQRLKNELSMCA
ncbi:unnamed protein product [Oreochromis niloticus]|nr:unnamed protein product [Mustela putorius furo]